MRLLILSVFISVCFSQSGNVLDAISPYVLPAVGIILAICVICCVLFFCVVCLELCRQKFCTKRNQERNQARPEAQPAPRPGGNPAPRNRNNRNNRNANSNSSNRDGSSSSGGGRIQSERYNDLNILADDIESTSTKKLKFNKDIFSIDNEQIKLKRRIRPVDQPEKHCNTFKVSLTHKPNKFFYLKFYSIPVKFFYSNDLFKKLEMEIEKLKRQNSNFSGSHIISLAGFSIRESTKKLGHIAEYCRTNIRKYSKKVAFRRKLTLLYNLASALENIDDGSFVYERVNYRNVLVDEKENIKLVDYRYDIILKKFFTLKENDLFWYYSPEKFANTEDLTLKHDIFSFGILMHGMLTDNWEPLKRFVKSGETFYSSKIKSDPTFRPKIDEKYLADDALGWYISLMKLCWGFESSVRPSFSNIKKIIKKNEGNFKDNTEELQKKNKKPPKKGTSENTRDAPSRGEKLDFNQNKPKRRRAGKRKTRVVSVSNLPDSDGILLPGEKPEQELGDVKIPKPSKMTSFNELDEDFISSVNEDALKVENNLFDEKQKVEVERKKKQEEEEKKKKKEEERKRKKREERKRRRLEEKERRRREKEKAEKEEFVLSSDSEGEDDANEDEEKQLIKLGIITEDEAKMNRQKKENEREAPQKEEEGELQMKLNNALPSHVFSALLGEKKKIEPSKVEVVPEIIEEKPEKEPLKVDDIEVEDPIVSKDEIKAEIEKEENEISKIEKELENDVAPDIIDETLEPAKLESELDISGEYKNTSEFEFKNEPEDDDDVKSDVDSEKEDDGIMFEDLSDKKTVLKNKNLHNVLDEDSEDVDDMFSKLSSLSNVERKEGEENRGEFEFKGKDDDDDMKFEIEDEHNSDDDGIIMENVVKNELDNLEKTNVSGIKKHDEGEDSDGVIFEKFEDEKPEKKEIVIKDSDEEDDEDLNISKSVIKDSDDEDDNEEKEEIEGKGVLFETLKGGVDMEKEKEKYGDEKKDDDEDEFGSFDNPEEDPEMKKDDDDDDDDGIIFE